MNCHKSRLFFPAYKRKETTTYADACLSTSGQPCIYLYKYLKSDLWIYNEVVQHFTKQGTSKFRCTANRTLFRILIAAVDTLKLNKVMISFRFHLNKPNTCMKILTGLDESWPERFLSCCITQALWVRHKQAAPGSPSPQSYFNDMHSINLRKNRVKSETSVVCIYWLAVSLRDGLQCWKAAWWRVLTGVNVCRGGEFNW